MSRPPRDPFPGLLSLRRGHSPNCSSAGSVVGVALATAVGVGAVLNAWAWWFLKELGEGGPQGEPSPEDAPDPTDEPAPPRLRREAFGGILAGPGALLYLDHDRADAAEAAGALPHGEVPPAAPEGALRAPTEVHLSVTERCPARCTGCYLSAGPEVQAEEPPKDALQQDLEALAEMGVFEVAFGGGEAALREDIFDLAERARALGMVPNMTTSGFGLTPTRAARAAELFGQVNVSIDGLGPVYAAARGWDGAARGLAALETLCARGARVGVNTVLSRPLLETPGALEALAIEITERGAQEWQWLRYKPAGRGLDAWEALAPTPAQLDDIWRRALAIERETGLQLRFDCALVPFLSDLPPAHLARMGVTGCPGGHSLLTRHADGAWAPCSFTAGAEADSPARAWAEDDTLRAWRERAAAPPEPCASCALRGVCRGGCRVVSAALLGDPMAPDPQCPRVRAHAQEAAK